MPSRNARVTAIGPIKEREQPGILDFELEPLIDMGFKSFKLLRAKPGEMTGF